MFVFVFCFDEWRYDQNYDIRDKARFLRALIFNNDKCPILAKHLKRILLASKPAPLLQSIYKDSDQFQLNTLSHALSTRVNGYTDLPDFPLEAPDPSVRNIEVPVEHASSGAPGGGNRSRAEGGSGSAQTRAHHAQRSNAKHKTDKFYSDEEDEDNSQSTGLFACSLFFFVSPIVWS